METFSLKESLIQQGAKDDQIKEHLELAGRLVKANPCLTVKKYRLSPSKGSVPMQG